MKNKFLLSIALMVFTTPFFSQELNCQVTIVADAKLELNIVDQDIIAQLKQTITDMMNNTQWSKDKFKVEERINCVLQLQIKEKPSTGTYSGSLQVQSSRPVFNSSYNTTVINYLDENVAFSFSRNALLVYAPNQYRDNLTSILAFYAYYIIGMDYDSFSLKGGTPYFNEAQQIVSLAQSSGASGWKSNESSKRNRFWLVDNVLHQLFEPLRECNYQYHRKGVDKLYEDKVAGRKQMFDALVKLNTVTQARPNSINLINFVQAKLTEIKEISEDAEQKDKTDIVNLMKKIDPSNASKYEEILQ
ncbi:MAG: DUF4835 family protein [Crocinitomicaceae bacterium]|nr:DUF4835 family protein [Crocinitomicaceae bacterium]MCF8410056.1 DUF4835 family protein [Crocinitomicaceae bacterium]MCF8444279.1 DUF4835 family protein [Crocinitomicaceae bacterium]